MAKLESVAEGGVRGRLRGSGRRSRRSSSSSPPPPSLLERRDEPLGC